MASRKIFRDFVLSKNLIYRQFVNPQPVRVSNTRLRLVAANRGPGVRQQQGVRQYSVFNEFSKQLKGEAEKNREFQQSVKEFKDKAEELKGATAQSVKEKAEELKTAKEDLKVRTKQTTEKLYKQVDSAWTEAEATAKKVSANLKEKVSAAREEVKETLGIGKQESAGSSDTSVNNSSLNRDNTKTASGDGKKQSGPSDSAQTLFSKVKSGVSSIFPKDTNVIGLAKKGYEIVKDELKGKPTRRKLIEYDPSSIASQPNVEKSSRTDITIVPVKESLWRKKWEAFKEKVQSHPISKRVSGFSEPVVAKGQEFAEDIRERWETSDNPVVHKIQDLEESVFAESHSASAFKKIRELDPSFTLPEFESEVQEVIKPVIKAYSKADTEVLKKYCSSEILERCTAERKAYDSQGIFFDNKILHVSEVEIAEVKLMGDTPTIVLRFQTQQVYCVRDRFGTITDGSKDTIQTVHHLWAMQLVGPEDLGEGAVYPMWRLRELQQVGIRALI